MELDERRAAAILRRHPAVVWLAEHTDPGTIAVVGGAVRDALLGRDVTDLDLSVSAGAEPLARRLAAAFTGRAVDLGRGDFPAWRVVAQGREIDIWDRRGGGLLDDLRRRDLTVNAIGWSMDTGAFVDPFSGRDDLATGRLREVDEQSFRSDPLRVLRLVRFAADLATFTVPAETVRLARSAVTGLVGIAAERVREELRKALARDPARALRWLVRSGAASTLVDASAREQKALLRSAALLPVAAECLHGLGAPAADPSLAGLALLVRSDHADPLGRLERLLERRWILRADASALREMLSWPTTPATVAVQRRLLHAIGASWPTLLLVQGVDAHLADDGEAWAGRAARLVARAAAESSRLASPPRLLDGDRIAALLGISGRSLGRAVDSLQQATVLGTVRSAQEAQSYLERLGGLGLFEGTD